MPVPEISEGFTGTVNRVTIGATKEAGGTRTSTVTVGGARNVVYGGSPEDTGEKPVIAIEGTGAQDAVQQGETGLLVPPQDPEALAAAIMALLRDEARSQAMGLAGREVVESRFTLAQMVRRTEELYTTLLEMKLASSFARSRGVA